MKPKPPYCFTACPLAKVTTGFVPPDSLEKAESALIAVILETPGKWDVFEGKGLVSYAGRGFFEDFVEPLGYGRKDVLIDHVLRCRPVNDVYPLRDKAAVAEKICRKWDLELKIFKPTIAIPTYSPSVVQREPTKTRLLERCVEKAFSLASKGERPVLLCGEFAVKTFLPKIPHQQEWFKKSFMGTWQGSVHEVTV